MKPKTSFIIYNKNDILDTLSSVSNSLYNYVNSRNSSFVLFGKFITHSDIITSMKMMKHPEFEKNLLYYLKTSDFAKIEKRTGKKFPTAHQSNICLSDKIYDFFGLPISRATSNRNYKISDIMPIKIANDSLEFFHVEHTKKVLDLLGKSTDKLDDKDFRADLSSGDFTDIDITCAVHGIGTQDDILFHKIRHNIFRTDFIYLLCEEELGGEQRLFIALEKNPQFFTITNSYNDKFEKYLQKEKEQQILAAKIPGNAVITINEEVTRKHQAKWREMLANEMMTFCVNDREIFCPFTYISVNYDDLGALFIASHIKGFSDENITEAQKYDINNGLLLSKNVDGLFDSHLISVNENRELVFSFLLEKDKKLLSQLLLKQPIFTDILNEKRMEYLKYHYQKFLEKEKERKIK